MALNDEKAPKVPRIGDGDVARTVKRDDSDEDIEVSESSITSSSEESKDEQSASDSSEVFI